VTNFDYNPPDKSKKITSKTIVALRILSQNPLSSRRFARAMWPESESWKDGGKRVVWAAGNYLAKLYNSGLVSKARWLVDGGVIMWKLSEFGENVLKEWREE
jgi:hypothetical protein